MSSLDVVRCAWCNEPITRPGDKITPDQRRVCPECGGANRIFAVAESDHPLGFVAAMIPTDWAPTGMVVR